MMLLFSNSNCELRLFCYDLPTTEELDAFSIPASPAKMVPLDVRVHFAASVSCGAVVFNKCIRGYK